MNTWYYLYLLLIGLSEGVVNAVAGGGSLLVYPVLLAIGVPPVPAAATTTFAGWPGAMSSAYGFKRQIQNLPRYFFVFLAPCLIGGLLGAIILNSTSSELLKYIAPWFILFGVVLLAVQNKLQYFLYKKEKIAASKDSRIITIVIIGFLLFLVSLYGGYFGSGLNIIFLAIIGLTELTNLQQMNGIKSLLTLSSRLAASSYFIIYKLIDWKVVPFLILGSFIGGYVGATYSAKLPSKLVRKIVVLAGLAIVIALLLKLK